MKRNRNMRPRNRTARGRPPLFLMNKSLHTRLSGRVVKGPSDPPTFVATPWNSITVALRYTNEKGAFTRSSLNFSGLESDIITQIGATEAEALLALDMRLKSIHAWSSSQTTGVAMNYSTVNMDVYDVVNTNPSDTNSRILASISDVSSKLRDAHVGFIYPVTQFNTVLQPAFQNGEIAGFDWNGETLTVYVQCLWRIRPPQTSVDVLREHALVAHR